MRPHNTTFKQFLEAFVSFLAHSLDLFSFELYFGFKFVMSDEQLGQVYQQLGFLHLNLYEPRQGCLNKASRKILNHQFAIACVLSHGDTIHLKMGVRAPFSFMVLKDRAFEFGGKLHPQVNERSLRRHYLKNRCHSSASVVFLLLLFLLYLFVDESQYILFILWGLYIFLDGYCMLDIELHRGIQNILSFGVKVLWLLEECF